MKSFATSGGKKTIDSLPKNFLNALRAKECVLFIGSGISLWSGLPDWPTLISRMVTFLCDHGLNDEDKTEIESLIARKDLITAASLCTSQMRRAELREFIDSVFIESAPRPHQIHKLITSLGSDSFITTNYDRLIEDA